MMIGISGPELKRDEAAFIGENGIGGVILFSRNYEDLKQLKKLTDDIRNSSNENLIISVDHEGGRVQRFGEPFTILPPMAEIRKAKDALERVRSAGETAGKELKAAGVNLNFAPVLDVLTNPKNPVIGDRAFSSDAEEVSRLGVAFIEAMQTEGVAACGKHFPGHGDADVDSHKGLPKLSLSRERFEECEFLPFHAAIDAGVATVMTAHILATKIDAEFPASVSKKTISILRDMGFDGLVVTDDLMMKGIADSYPPEESACMAIAAGSDVALVCAEDLNIHRRVFDSLVGAVSNGRISRRVIDRALDRMSSFPF